MQRSLVGFTLAMAALSAPAQVGLPPQPGGSQDGTPSVSTGSIPLTYTGGDSRASIGIDQDGNTQGELSSVFGNNGEHAIVAQLWWQNGGAGGVQADYNWLFASTLEQAKQDPDSITVAKLSFAIDQNAEKDRQANIGFAIERKEFFLNFYLAGKVSGARKAGALVVQRQDMLNGSDDIGNYTQTQTEIDTTPLDTQAYSYTVGAHGGHFSDALTARFNGGFDYSRGNQGAHEQRYSVGVDKYLGTRGWSVSGIAEHTQSSLPFSGSRSDDRWWFFVRYEFGGGGAFTANAGDTAWIQRALRAPVVGHPRDVKTYVTRRKTTTATTLGTKLYTARRPLARDDTASVVQNSVANAVDVLANDTDPDGGLLSIAAIGNPTNGSAQIAGTHVTYTPAPGFVGSDEFTYTISNPKGLAATAKIHVTVNAAVLRPPNAQDDAATTAYATPVTIPVLANDNDPNGFSLTLASATAPAHGTEHINADGTIAYAPAAGFSGTDRFSYTASNGHGGSATAQVTIVVQPPLPPIAQNDSATTAIATPVAVPVLANDSDPNGFPLTITAVSNPANGTAKRNANGAVTYSPQSTFIGTDTFTYSIANGHGGTASAIVTITVTPPNGVLVAQDDIATTAYAKPVSIDILANDSAPAGLSLVLTNVAQPAHGTVQVGIGGLATYTPSSAFNGGTDAFSYTVTDGLASASATVTVTVLPPGTPLAQPDNAATAFNTPVTIAVLANDSDPSGFILTVTSVSVPAHGTAIANPNGTVTYTPQADYFGPDAFSYMIGNGHGGSASANVAISVQAAPPPVAQPDSATTGFNKPVIVAVLANDSDPSGFTLSVTGASTPTHGTSHVNTDGSVTYTPVSTYSGPDTFTYTINNGHGGTASAAVSVTIQAALPPIAQPDTATTAFNQPVTIAVLGNDNDPNNLALTVSNVTVPQSGAATATANSNGTITYTPTAAPLLSGYDDTFSYTISDGYNTATATVTVSVQEALPPVANPDSATTPFATPVTINLVANDTDPNGLPLTLGFVPNTLPSGAVVETLSTTSIKYTPSNEFSGKDVFSYQVTDGLTTVVGNVTVTVQLPAAATAGSFSVPGGTICSPNGNFCDICLDDHITNPAGLVLTLTVASTTALGGSASVSTSPPPGCSQAAHYTSPDPSFFGQHDSFTYSVRDIYNRTSTGSIGLTLN